MRASFAPVVMAAAIALPAFAQDTQPASADTVAKARAVLEETAKAYRDAVAIEDVAKLKAKSPMGEQGYDLRMLFGKGTDSMVSLPGMEVTALDGQLFLTIEDSADKYLQVPLEGGLEQTFSSVMGGDGSLPVQFSMRANRGIDQYITALGMGLLTNPQISSLEMLESEDGKPLHAITLAAEEGTSTVNVNRDTKLISSIQLIGTPPGAPPNFEITFNVAFDPKVKESADGLITFEPADRTMVASFEKLVPQPAQLVKVGDAAPDFTIDTLGGESVTLSKLQGEIVILDFWATWCPPCRRGLPLLQTFADWVDSNGHPVKVYGVNVWERVADVEGKRKKAADYWSEQKFTMTSLWAPDDVVPMSYGIQGIPLTVVIGPDGVIANVHTGFDPKMAETLKAEVQKLLETEG